MHVMCESVGTFCKFQKLNSGCQAYTISTMTVTTLAHKLEIYRTQRNLRNHTIQLSHFIEEETLRDSNSLLNSSPHRVEKT